MTDRPPPRYAIALLEWLVPGSDALAGDLLEEFRHRPSRWRVWREVLAAIAKARLDRSDDIRPLRLVELQPADAVERTRRIAGRLRSVNMAPFATVGGSSLAILLLLMTVVMPVFWWLFAASIVAGIALAVVLIAAHRKSVG